jgi:predicted DNA-binding protein (UPF0251 family)
LAKVQAAGAAAGAAARSKAVLVTNIETGEAVSYISQRQAARELQVSEKTLRNYVKSGKALKGI